MNDRNSPSARNSRQPIAADLGTVAPAFRPAAGRRSRAEAPPTTVSKSTCRPPASQAAEIEPSAMPTVKTSVSVVATDAEPPITSLVDDLHQHQQNGAGDPEPRDGERPYQSLPPSRISRACARSSERCSSRRRVSARLRRSAGSCGPKPAGDCDAHDGAGDQQAPASDPRRELRRRRCQAEWRRRSRPRPAHCRPASSSVSDDREEFRI